MILVVALSLVHGLLIIPAMLYLISLIPYGNGQTFALNSDGVQEEASHSDSGPIKPTCLEVNLKM